jgi:hypothetical protein
MRVHFDALVCIDIATSIDSPLPQRCADTELTAGNVQRPLSLGLRGSDAEQKVGVAWPIVLAVTPRVDCSSLARDVPEADLDFLYLDG